MESDFMGVITIIQVYVNAYHGMTVVLIEPGFSA